MFERERDHDSITCYLGSVISGVQPRPAPQQFLTIPRGPLSVPVPASHDSASQLPPLLHQRAAWGKTPGRAGRSVQRVWDSLLCAPWAREWVSMVFWPHSWLFHSCQRFSLLTGLCFLCLPLKCWHSPGYVQTVCVHTSHFLQGRRHPRLASLCCVRVTLSTCSDPASFPLRPDLYLVPCEFPTGI